jgi:putative SOS response-associated peptidase YedK
MCGRFVLTATPEELQALFGYLDGEDFPPRYNIAPTQPVAIVRMVGGARRFALVRWGLIPSWVEDPRKFSLLINARAEGILDKASFRNAMRYRRCLVPASGFYEWRRMPGSNSGRTRQPFWLRPRDGRPIAFAGLWETWHDRATGAEIDSVAIVTTIANRIVAPIHDRMPVVIAAKDFEQWLSGEPADADALLKAAPDDLFEAVEISNRVNSAANDDPRLLDPVQATLL